MKIEKEYEEFLRLLNKHEVKYCIIGSYAVAFYAKPRYTEDIDILVEPNPSNAKRIMNALDEFGFGGLAIPEEDFCADGNIIQLGYEPVRIDLMTELKGFQFEEVWKNKVVGDYGDEKVYFIGLDDLIRYKIQAARPLDKIDIPILKKAKEQAQED